MTEFSKHGLAHALKLPEREFMTHISEVERTKLRLQTEQEITRLVYDLEEQVGQPIVIGTIKCERLNRGGKEVMGHETRLDFGI